MLGPCVASSVWVDRGFGSVPVPGRELISGRETPGQHCKNGWNVRSVAKWFWDTLEMVCLDALVC